jgi:hypothetical protein
MSERLNLKTLSRGLAAAGLLAALHAGSHAQEAAAPLFIGGVQASSLGGYGYAGVIKPFAGARLGQGWFQRAVASVLTYRYDATVAGRTRNVHARAPGLEFAVGRAWSGERASLELSAGVGVRHTRLSPEDPSSDTSGTQWAFTPQLVARQAFTNTVDGDVLASYSAGPNSRYVRARLGARPAQGSWRVGPEAMLSSGENYRQVSVGLFGARSLAAGLSLEVSIGRLRARDGKEDPYVAVGVTKSL